MNGDFVSNSIAYGFHMLEFNNFWKNIPKRTRTKLIILVARMVESSYRRGCQQALYLYLKGRIPQNRLEKILSGHTRYSISLDKAPCLEGPELRENSAQSLWIEYGMILNELGFYQ